MQAIKVYNMREVDELVFLDVMATLEGRPPDTELIDVLADECFMPLTVGGGVTTVDEVHRLFAVGADKVSIGTAACLDTGLVSTASSRFGAQSIVVSIDFRLDDDGTPRVWIRSGTQRTERRPVDLARQLEAEGAGEILLTSIDRDGTMLGYDLDVLAATCAAVNVPVIASGGASGPEDMMAAIEAGASALAAASIFHFTQQTPLGIKQVLRNRNVAVRLP